MNKKKLALMATGAILAMSLAVGGATYAMFTSSAQNTGNSFMAGTVHLKIDRDTGDTIPGPMFYSAASDPTGKFPYDTTKNPYRPPGGESIGGWAPGDTATRAINIYNDGSLEVKVDKLKAKVNSAGVTSGPAYDEFIQKMNVEVLYPSERKTLYNGPLSGLLSGDIDITPFVISAPPSGPANITFTASLDKSAGNLIQGQSFVFDFEFTADQTANNP